MLMEVCYSISNQTHQRYQEPTQCIEEVHFQWSQQELSPAPSTLSIGSHRPRQYPLAPDKLYNTNHLEY